MAFPFRTKGRGLALSLGLAAGMIGCRKEQAPPAMPPPAVTVAQPIEHDVVDWDEYTGRLEAVDMVEVRARVSGMVTGAPFNEGSIVDKNAPLFVLDNRPFQAELDRATGEVARAQSRLDLAGTEFKRVEGLKQSGSVAETEYEQRKQDFRQAEAALTVAKATAESARLNVEFTEVRAPITGRISRKMVTPGNLINGGAGQATMLTTVTALDPIYCYVEADENSVLKYQRLARQKKRVSARDTKIPALLALADETDFKRRGFVDFVDNRLDPSTGTLQARAVFENPDLTLTPGLFARLKIPGSGRYKAMLVSDLAIGTDQGQRFVSVVNPDNTVEARRVVLGGRVGGLRAVREGLKKDDWIIVNGLMAAMMRPDRKVTPQKAVMPNADAVDKILPAILDTDWEEPATGPATQMVAPDHSTTQPASQPSTRSAATEGAGR